MTKRQLKPLTALFPVPVVLVSCGDAKPNIITIAWTGVVSSEPPTVSISVRSSRHSHGLITRTGQFVVNLPAVDLLEASDYCGMVSGRDVDKFAASNLTPLPAVKVSAPLIKECPVNIECTVTHTVNLGSHDLFIGKVELVHMDESMVDERGQVNYSAIKPFTYVPMEYWGVGERLEMYGFTVRKNRGLGQ